MSESELMKASQDLSNRLFWNEFWLRSIRHRTCRTYRGNNTLLVVIGLIELMFWVVIGIVLIGTLLMSLCGYS